MSQKVLMFGWEFPPYNSGGLGVACLGLTQALVEKGVDVTFVLPKKFELQYDHLKFVFADTKTVITKENYKYYKQLLNAYSTTFVEDEYIRSIVTDLHNPVESGDIYSEVIKYAILSEEIIKNTNFDLIHCHDWLTIESGILAKKITGKPLIFHIHATEIDRTGGFVNQVIYDIEKKGMEIADKVVAVSQFTKDIIIKHYGISPDKIEVVHNGIDYYLQKSGQRDQELIDNLNQLKNLGTKFVTFIGRLTFQKGVEYLLEAAKIVSEHNSDIKFLIAGSGDLEQSLIQKTAQLGLSSKVIFPGFLRDEKLKALYEVSDLLVMPSVNEPFGLVALEALSHQTPVILSKSSGVAEVITNSLKVDFWDTDQMANLILSTIAHQTLHTALTNSGHLEVQQINWHKAAQKFINIYSNQTQI
jgi:glycosyltransferase involved in cell wall biosynthesis